MKNMTTMGLKLFCLILLLALLPACADSDDDDAGADSGQPQEDDDNDDNDDNDASPSDDDSGDDDTSPAPTGLQPGLYQVTGSDSQSGAYEGTVEIRGEDEDPDFIRVVRYADLSFPDPLLDLDYEVHSVWTGRVASTDPVRVELTLKVADTITEYNGLVRKAEDGEPVEVVGEAAEMGNGNYSLHFQTVAAAAHQLTADETWTYSGPGGEQPIFQDEDSFVPGHDPMPDFLHDLLFLLLRDYHALEFFDPYRDRPEFDLAVHYIAQFHTDFEWYRAHPGALRVVGKWLDDISLAETMLRARGFSPTLAQKAAWFDEDMPRFYVNPLGMFSAALTGSDPLLQSESGDGLLWTGCYLAGQVFRYLTTGDAAALDNWLQALDGLFLSHDIVQDPTSFARTVRPHVAGGGKEWIQGAAPYEAYDWLCCGNNDMIQGLYYGYLLSWIFLPAEAQYDEYRAGIAERAARLADYGSVANDGQFNEIKAHWLAYLTTGEDTYRQHYQELWSNPFFRLYVEAGDGKWYVYGITDWSGQHLETIGMLILHFLAEATGDEEAQAIIERGWTNGMRLNRWTQTLFPIAAEALGDPPADVDAVFENAIWGMRELAYPKQSLAIDKRIDPAWCASPLPDLPWKFDWMQGGRFQGVFGMPMFDRMHPNMWITSTSEFQVGASDWMDGGGADFLHAYWLGRYYGVFDEND
ncbi:MAG: hypothetical protein GX444_01155 [Myxococcales bacterium]|nr:hypothetical protein [Myxococcales bacterium]